MLIREKNIKKQNIFFFWNNLSKDFLSREINVW